MFETPRPPEVAMRALFKLVILGVAGTVVYRALPPDVKERIPRPWAQVPLKPLRTISISEAISIPASGVPTVTFLYLSALPSNVEEDLAKNIKAWRKRGIEVRGYSIDPVRQKDSIASYVRHAGFDIDPTWIEMPDGPACAFNQMRAVNYFTQKTLDPQVTIPLLSL